MNSKTLIWWMSKINFAVTVGKLTGKYSAFWIVPSYILPTLCYIARTDTRLPGAFDGRAFRCSERGKTIFYPTLNNNAIWISECVGVIIDKSDRWKLGFLRLPGFVTDRNLTYKKPLYRGGLFS
jgi:hypothetical protein